MVGKRKDSRIFPGNFKLMKKKLLFVHPYMNLGGVESALVAALRLLSPEKYDITLMLDKLGGPMFDEIPEYVKVTQIPLNEIGNFRRKNGWAATVKHAVKTGRLWYAARMIALKLWWALIYRWRGIAFNEIETFQLNKEVDASKLPRGFDFALAYFGGIMNGDFVSRYYNDAITSIWFHNQDIRFKYWRYREVTKRYDRVFACSKSLADFFNKILSKGDIYFETMPHYVDLAEYRTRAGDGDGLPKCDRLKILTVARVTHQKGVDLAIEAAKRLKNDGCIFTWYVVGDGEDMEMCKCLVEKAELENSFVFLGARKNPFPCYRDCDIYVQPSRWEAYCLSLAEARAFAKPIVTTDFIGAREQISLDQTGLIVPTYNVEALTSAIERLLQDERLRIRLSENLGKANLTQIGETKNAWDEFLSMSGKRKR